MATRWADLPIIRDTESGIAAIEREQMTKPRPLDTEEPALHQPSGLHQAISNESYQRDYFAFDEITDQSVKLIQYCRQLRALIYAAKQQAEAVKSGAIKMCSFPTIPSLPTSLEPRLKHRLLKPVPFLQKDLESAFVRGVGPIPPEVTAMSCRRLLRRSVAVVCAHASFDSCMESCLETLSDAVHDFLNQMAKLLRFAVDSEASCTCDCVQAASCLDVVCQVFREMGIGGPETLHEYFQSHLIDYQSHLMHTCKQLQQEYREIVQPHGTEGKIRQASISHKEDVTEDIHFPCTEESDDNGLSENMLSLDHFEASNSQDCDNMMAVEEDIGTAAVMSSGMMTRSKQGGVSKTDHEDRQASV